MQLGAKKWLCALSRRFRCIIQPGNHTPPPPDDDDAKVDMDGILMDR